LVTGLFSIPEGMAYASIGGFNPIAGLYAGMIPTIVGSFFARTVLMVTTLTSAIALSSQSALKTAGLDPTRPANIAALVLAVGIVMAVLGLLRAGSIMNFVSNAVMTGFTTGIAVQIITGVLKDATGYQPHSSNTLGKLADSLVHIGSWDGTAVAVAASTIAVWAIFRLIKPVASLATLIALVVVTAVVVAAGIDVDNVGDIASVPNAFPKLTTPDWSALPHLALGAVAVSLVALAQAAGIAATEPNPDGTRSNASRDFLAQGLANVAGSAFGALPTGGSLSRTGVAVSAGARTRWAGIFSGIWLIGVVVLFGSVAEKIPMPVIGGLILVIGVELVVGRLPDIILVVKTAPLSALAMVLTFAATTQFPLQDAILIGAVISLLLYCVAAARHADLVALEQTATGQWRITTVPATVASGSVTVLYYAGVGLFAEVPRLDEKWPTLTHTSNAVVLLSLRTLPDVPSSAVIKAFERRSRALAQRHSKLMLVDVTPELRRILDRSGLTAILGADNIIMADPEVFSALNHAMTQAQRWIAERGAAQS
jgi:SulP family sulfate permease